MYSSLGAPHPVGYIKHTTRLNDGIISGFNSQLEAPYLRRELLQHELFPFFFSSFCLGPIRTHQQQQHARGCRGAQPRPRTGLGDGSAAADWLGAGNRDTPVGFIYYHNNPCYSRVLVSTTQACSMYFCLQSRISFSRGRNITFRVLLTHNQEQFRFW